MTDLFTGRMRGLIRDWTRYWTRHDERWYDERFASLPPDERTGVMEAAERLRTDMTLIANAFRENR